MKNYNRFMMLSILCYVLCAITFGVLFMNTKESSEHLYRVEANRIMEDFNGFDTIDVAKLEIISSVEYLAVENKEKEVIQSFYNESNTQEMMIQPWYQKGELKGYVKFNYETKDVHTQQLFYLTQGALFFLELVFILFLLYMKKRIIRPFHRLQTLPYELSKGHFKGEIHIQKSRYFKEYLWGMSQLKDTLDVTRKRQYDLMKEKKQLLLSLSHDIKTPLSLIKLYSKALEEKVCDDEQSRTYAISQIEKKSDEIEHYVESIITSTKEDVIDFDVENSEFYLADIFHQVFDVYVEQCHIRNIACRIGTYENRLLKGDIHRAQEVIENIFENAFKYGDGQYIEVTFDEEEYHQLIHIKNSGAPLQSQEVHHVFDSFFRGTNAQGVAGSGLGLYICKELMRKMEGAIYVVRHEDGMEFVLVFQ